ncbi:MAG: MBL fold metallo-hydrolase [Bacteroidota bacterium]|nr:MBL fold metallo-hydrolase [Bacteroidota bacterium]
MHPPLTITFLGTGTSSGVPMIACPCNVCQSADPRDKRLRSSILVQSATTSIVVDTGPDFRYQMLRAHVTHLDGIIFTHPHKDHVAGLDDVRAFNFFSGKPMNIYANELTQEVIIREFPYAFTDTKYPGLPEITLNPIDSQPFTIGDITILPITVWHLKMPVLAFRFGDFTYITDANRIEESEKEKIKGCDTIVLNALRKEKHVSHFSLDEAIAMAAELGARQTLFTHLSHQMGLHAEIDAALPENIRLAYDNLRLQMV